MAADDGAATVSPIIEDVSPKGSPRAAPATVTQDKKEDDPKRVEEREALEYWGYLVKPDKCGSDKLNQLLQGIAQYIVCFTTVTNDHKHSSTPYSYDMYSLHTLRARKIARISRPPSSLPSTAQ